MSTNGKRINPYTQIAALHNKGIDYVFRKLKERQQYAEEINFETILEIVSEYVAKIQNNNSKSDIAANYAVLANFFNTDRDGIIDKMLEQKNVPKEVIEYLNKIRNLSDNLHPEEIISILSNVENELLNSRFTNEDIKYVLLYIAIAKGSLKDWTQNANLRFPEMPRETGWPWKDDAESALQAALIGPVDFFITGGTLTIVSVVGGSVVASTWTAIKRKKRNK